MDKIGRIITDRPYIVIAPKNSKYQSENCYAIGNDIKINIEGDKLIGRKDGSIVLMLNINDIDAIYPM